MTAGLAKGIPPEAWRVAFSSAPFDRGGPGLLAGAFVWPRHAVPPYSGVDGKSKHQRQNEAQDGNRFVNAQGSVAVKGSDAETGSGNVLGSAAGTEAQRCSAGLGSHDPSGNRARTSAMSDSARNLGRMIRCAPGSTPTEWTACPRKRSEDQGTHDRGNGPVAGSCALADRRRNDRSPLHGHSQTGTRSHRAHLEGTGRGCCPAEGRLLNQWSAAVDSSRAARPTYGLLLLIAGGCLLGHEADRRPS